MRCSALGSQSVARPSKTVTEIEGRQLTLSNLDKVLYPATGFTKAAVVDYYARIAPFMLPHLRGRALTMVRWPDGVDGESFFEKRCPPHAPDWVRTATVDGVRACVVDEVATLAWTANLAALELHTPQATVDDPGHPTSLVLDLDPGPPAGVLECCRVALRLHEMLEQLGLVAVVKTSGGKGLHLAVPVRGATADATKAFARALGQLLAKESPDRVTIVMARRTRGSGVRRLEPERSAQDHGLCVLVTSPALAVGLGTAVVGRGVERARHRRRGCARARRGGGARSRGEHGRSLRPERRARPGASRRWAADSVRR